VLPFIGVLVDPFRDTPVIAGFDRIGGRRESLGGCSGPLVPCALSSARSLALGVLVAGAFPDRQDHNSSCSAVASAQVVFGGVRSMCFAS